ncbi:sarcosine oxidase subunit gamma [Silicimonas algicola]|uniref:Heterotetrameric sarcosine oxidase gamma subunit n=1 Tax=Silicimonas algicola TaxID=1826607 RepID=A0A316GKN5_9RHOB|nr:sarcosine oxidase subunit gamma family protein [Silicimonas algicola]AZQ67077.1 sarcosine oxidase subunit gamma [Silicimonas algicola]PWK55397.1 heterotetrameric sarcosine oxidase gamma subunit [Silicimonas algicola]
MNKPMSSEPEVLAESAAVRVRLAKPCARLSLRARGDLAPLEAALGLSLPGKIGERCTGGELEALRLGPDEWMLHLPEGTVEGVLSSCAGVYETLPHSLVDVSGREVTFQIDGARATELLTLGMARDPESIAVGEGRRTNFDGVTVTIWRDADSAYRMDVWHSFAPHVLHLLETGCRELAAEAV